MRSWRSLLNLIACLAGLTSLGEHGLGSNYGEGAFHRVDLKELRYPAQLYLGRDRRFGHVSEISVHQESCKKSDSMFCVSSLPFELPYGQIVHLID